MLALRDLSFFTRRGAVCLWSWVVNFFCSPSFTRDKKFWPSTCCPRQKVAPFWVRNCDKGTGPSSISSRNFSTVWQICAECVKKWPPSLKNILPPSLTPKKLAPPFDPLKNFAPPPQTTPNNSAPTSRWPPLPAGKKWQLPYSANLYIYRKPYIVSLCKDEYTENVLNQEENENGN